MSAILCLAALLWTLSTLASLRARFDEVGNRCDKNDFACYYIYAYAMRDGVNPYTEDLRLTAHSYGLKIKARTRTGYPPTFVLCMELLTLLTFGTAYWVWSGLNFAALLLSLYLLLRKDLELDAKTGLSLAALALFYQPIAVSFGWGQPHMILLLMMVVAWLCFQQGNDRAGGLTLAFAGLLKIYPLFLVGYLLVKRRWSAIVFTALGLLIGGAATMALVGLSRTVAFAGRLPDRINGGWLASVHQLGSPSLINLDTFISRLFWELTGTGWNGPLDWVRRLLVVLAQIALLALTVRETATKRSGRGSDQRAFALWMAVVALLSPTAWVHYMILLLVPFAVLAAQAIRGQASSSAIWLGAASFFLVILSVPPDFLVSLPPHFSLLDYSVSFFTILAAILPRWLLRLLTDNWFFALTILAYASVYRLTTGSTTAEVVSGR
ncbi:MAG: glycosyltransferase family 87 protein [Candidatus Binataceae bacterium]